MEPKLAVCALRPVLVLYRDVELDLFGYIRVRALPGSPRSATLETSNLFQQPKHALPVSVRLQYPYLSETMLLYLVALRVGTVIAAAVHLPNRLDRGILNFATPGARVTSDLPTASTEPSIVGRGNWTVDGSDAAITSTPTIPSGDGDEDDGEDGEDGEEPSSSCTPRTICMDKMTCGIRYGG
jgi:hypothetical protein